jgi:predicted esterase
MSSRSSSPAPRVTTSATRADRRRRALQRANIAASLLLRRPYVLRGAALLRPMLPYEPEQAPDLTGTDVLVAAGERDPYAPREQVERLVEILREAGADVQAHVEAGAGHGLTNADLLRTARWTRALVG